eukprot:5196424-Amphidinium_carterae.1
MRDLWVRLSLAVPKAAAPTSPPQCPRRILNQDLEVDVAWNGARDVPVCCHLGNLCLYFSWG